jgi:hypothetical protein
LPPDTISYQNIAHPGNFKIPVSLKTGCLRKSNFRALIFKAFKLYDKAFVEVKLMSIKSGDWYLFFEFDNFKKVIKVYDKMLVY